MIEIKISAHYGPDMPRLRMQVDEALEAIGFRREAAVPVVYPDFSAMESHNRAGMAAGPVSALRPVGKAGELAYGYGTQAGQPAPAEPEVLMRAAPIDPTDPNSPSVGVPAQPEAPKPSRRGRPAKAGAAPAAEQPAISPGENRVGPQDPPEVQEQDAADEAAETAATRKADATLDDVRGALGDYVAKFGMAAAQEDGPKVLKLLFGDGVAKISTIPEGADNFARAVAGVREMTEKNPFKREAVNG